MCILNSNLNWNAIIQQGQAYPILNKSTEDQVHGI